MAQNFNLGSLGQMLTVNAVANTMTLAANVIIGNSSANIVLSGNSFVMPGSVNAAVYTIGTNFIANTTGVYSTGIVNATSYTIGTNFIANTTGVYSTGDVVTSYSDMRLKTVTTTITNALSKVEKLSGFYYVPNDTALSLGIEKEVINRVGVSAQEVLEVLPEAVRDAPGVNGYLTVQYDRIVPLLIEAIKELKNEIEELKRGK
jgi:hypothetical protein